MQHCRRRAAVAAFVFAWILVAIWTSGPAEAAGKGEAGPVFPVRVELTQKTADLDVLKKMDLDVDGVFSGWARIYVIQEEVEKLERLGYQVTPLPVEPPAVLAPELPVGPVTMAIPTTYHTYETLTSELQAIEAAYPTLTHLYTIGQSVEGRELWMLKISADVDVESDEPEVAYTGAMHGDEVVGKELLIELIHDLLDNYATNDPRATDLIDNTVLWIMPSTNPDGTAAQQRYNANNYDLNRNFPDWYSDPVNTPAGRQAETRAVMSWVEAESIVLSANFHGGTLVANYPWDNNETGSSVPSPTPDPDDAALHSISLSYAENNPPMYASSEFVNGVTNGADWYAIDGGMQDWSYAWYGKWDVTMEISHNDWPDGSLLPDFWDDNRESMLSYFERVHEGLRGLVTDAATGAPLAAEVRLDSNPFAVYTDPDVGDYHRIVLPGSYSMEVSAAGYNPTTLPVVVSAGPAVRYDVALQPLPADLQPIATVVDDGVAGNGWLDAGETADLAVTLKNLGNSATNVSGRLIPTGWYGTVTREDATFENMGNQESAESDAPHYGVAVDPMAPTGHHAGFAIEWVADQGKGVSEPVFLDVGGPSCVNGDAQSVPEAILDYQTFTNQLEITSSALIDDVQVTLDIQHTYIGDLTLTLISPTGTRVILHNGSGGSANDIVGTYGDDLTPAEPLSGLAGESTLGTWGLEIKDSAGGDTGQLNAWSVESCGSSAEASIPEMRIREVSIGAGSVELHWWTYPGLTSYRVYRSADPTTGSAFIDVTSEDGDDTDTTFVDTSTTPLSFYLVTGVGAQGEGAKGHFGE